MEFNDSALADLNNANDVHPLRGANSQMERIKGFEGEAEHPDPIPCQLVVMVLEGDRSIVLNLARNKRFRFLTSHSAAHSRSRILYPHSLRLALFLQTSVLSFSPYH